MYYFTGTLNLDFRLLLDMHRDKQAEQHDRNATALFGDGRLDPRFLSSLAAKGAGGNLA